MLQTRTVEPGTLGLLKRLMALTELNHFYLVGGTALALQTGHRVSVDLDLFTELSFDRDVIFNILLENFNQVILEGESKSALVTNIDEVKVDFAKMAYPILFQPLIVEGVRMLDLRDIAPMKLKAIVQRGSKKDFYDLYFLLDFFSLDEILVLFKRKFSQEEIFHVIKSLTYFEDAEQYANPMVFDKMITWPLVKNRIIEEAQKLRLN